MSANTPSASEIMSTHLATIAPGAPLLEAYELMQERRIRHLPVVNDRGQVVGLLSDRDLQRAMEPSIQPSPVESIALDFDPAFKVKDFMSWPVRSVADSTSVLAAIDEMLAAKLSALLVLGPSSRPRGIITTDDLLLLLKSLLEKDPSSIKLSLSELPFMRGDELGYLS